MGGELWKPAHTPEERIRQWHEHQEAGEMIWRPFYIIQMTNISKYYFRFALAYGQVCNGQFALLCPD